MECKINGFLIVHAQLTWPIMKKLSQKRIEITKKKKVKLGNDKVLDVKGIGRIYVAIKDIKILDNTSHTPSLKHNLLSVRQ